MIISTKIPKKTYNVFYELNKFSTHAEKDAFKKVKNIKDVCIILIVKVVNNILVQAHPCDMCKKLLLKKGFDKMLNYDLIK